MLTQLVCVFDYAYRIGIYMSLFLCVIHSFLINLVGSFK